MNQETHQPDTAVGELTAFQGTDLHDICDAADAAIIDGGGFGWLTPPTRETMESYWNGVLLIGGRRLFVARLDGTIAGSGQLVRPARNNEANALCATLTTFFISPWARGYGLAARLLNVIEQAAVGDGFSVLNLDVRETQERAIQLYEQKGYHRWGTHPHYAFVAGHWVAGQYYYKSLYDEVGEPS